MKAYSLSGSIPTWGHVHAQNLKILLLIVVLALSGTVLFAVEKQEMQKVGTMPDPAAPGAKATVLI